jgi:hypothetical protein
MDQRIREDYVTASIVRPYALSLKKRWRKKGIALN